MGFSPLADMKRRIPDGGRSSPRLSRVTGFGIHHNAGVDAYGEATRPGREVSAHYWITNAGDILPHVDEDRRAWTSGHPSYPAGALADHRNITVEVSNSPEGVRNGTWAISDAARDALIALIADVHKRHGLGPVQRGATRGVGVHSDWVATECPGPYIKGHLGTIITEAERARTGTPEPIIEEDPMPERYMLPSHNPNQVCKPKAWTTIYLNAKRWVSILNPGAKPRRGTAYVALVGDGDFEVRLVYDTVNPAANEILKREASVAGPAGHRTLHSWPIGLPAKEKNTEQRIRVQVRPTGTKPVKITGVRPIVDYWEN